MRYGTIGVLAFLMGGIVWWNVSLSLEERQQVGTSSFMGSDEERNTLEQNLEKARQEQEVLIQEGRVKEQLFLRDGLMTDTSKAVIDIDKILDGGPGKDGIPAIDVPLFLSQGEVREQMSYLIENALGIVIADEYEQRFYPYAIMNWHEIVNDERYGMPIAVTFCPLCGSAIVFDRRVGDEVLRFAVSGKLFESNLLMYDDLTESLWSQARGKAVVGEFVDTKLTHVRSDVMSYGQFQENYPEGVVLSDDTGWNRNYARAPYGDYDVNDRLFFPVSNTDARLPKKEILYVVNDGELSVAFVKSDLVEAGEASLDVDGVIYKAVFGEGKVTVMIEGEVLPGYHEMFFSWATHNVKSKNIWFSEDE